MAFDLQPTEEQQALVQTLRDLSEAVLRPAARSCEAAGRTSPEPARLIHEIGVTAPVPEELGGGGTLDAVTYVMAAEELAWGDPGIAYQALGSGLAAIVVDRAGSDEQRVRYLPAFAEPGPAPTFVASGEKVAAGDLENLEARIEDGKVVAEKYGVLNARDARFGLVVGLGPEGLTAALVEGEAFEVVKPEDKLGLAAAPTSVVRFDTASEALPAGGALESAALYIKLMTGAIAVGCARASLEYAARYAREREAFGKPIGAFQAISFKIADMAIDVDAARMSLWRTAWKLDRGTATYADAASAVGQALAAAVRCGDDAVQILGGHGYIKDHPVEMWFRDAVTLSVFDAPDVLGDLAVARSAVARSA
jgi:alkylation response protein AidB-like acyl-CoA dehydrogenase